MPYLVLDPLPFWEKGKDPVKLITLIDSVRGDVHEVSIRIIGHVQRKPRFSEVQYAAGVLAGKDDVDGRLTRGELVQHVHTLERARVQMEELNEGLRDREKRIAELLKENTELQTREIDDETTAILVTALELRIVELAETQNLGEYAKAKDAYRRVTGRSWIEDDD